MDEFDNQSILSISSTNNVSNENSLSSILNNLSSNLNNILDNLNKLTDYSKNLSTNSNKSINLTDPNNNVNNLLNNEMLSNNGDESASIIDKSESGFTTLNYDLIKLRDDFEDQSKEFNNLKRKLDDHLNDSRLNLKKDDEDKKLINDKILKIYLELDNLKKQLNESRSIKLCLVKDNIDNFFESNNKFYSESTKFLNLEWSIIIKPFIYEKIQYLSFYLKLQNEIDDINNVKWECETFIEFRLLGEKFGDEYLSFTKKLNKTFKKSTKIGYRDFISKDVLLDINNNYIKDNSIKLEIYLIVNKLNRNID